MVYALSTELSPREIIGHTPAELASGLELMESSINYGKNARVALYTEALPDEVQLAEMYLGIISTGHHISYPTAIVVNGIPTTQFVIRKGSPQWQLIVPLLIPLFTIGLVVFGITRIESISSALMPLVLVTVFGLVILATVVSKPATKYLERGGSLTRLASTSKKPLAVR